MCLRLFFTLCCLLGKWRKLFIRTLPSHFSSFWKEDRYIHTHMVLSNLRQQLVAQDTRLSCSKLLRGLNHTHTHTYEKNCTLLKCNCFKQVSCSCSLQNALIENSSTHFHELFIQASSLIFSFRQKWSCNCSHNFCSRDAAGLVFFRLRPQCQFHLYEQYLL